MGENGNGNGNGKQADRFEDVDRLAYLLSIERVMRIEAQSAALAAEHQQAVREREDVSQRLKTKYGLGDADGFDRNTGEIKRGTKAPTPPSVPAPVSATPSVP